MLQLVLYHSHVTCFIFYLINSTVKEPPKVQCHHFTYTVNCSYYTVFPRKEARASISFHQAFTPASKQDRTLIEAGVYYLMSVEAFVDSNYSYIKITMAASRRVAVRSVYEKESVVRGHHIYKASWAPSIGEESSVKREDDNLHDNHAVAVMKNGNISQLNCLEAASFDIFSATSTALNFKVVS